MSTYGSRGGERASRADAVGGAGFIVWRHDYWNARSIIVRSAWEDNLRDVRS